MCSDARQWQECTAHGALQRFVPSGVARGVLCAEGELSLCHPRVGEGTLFTVTRCAAQCQKNSRRLFGTGINNSHAVEAHF